MSPSRAVRVARGSTTAGIATFIAPVSHITGGGQMPGWIGIALPAVLSVAVRTLLAGRQMSLWRLSVAVVASQALFPRPFVLLSVLASTSLPPALALDMHHANPMAPQATIVAIGRWLEPAVVSGTASFHRVAIVATIHRTARPAAALAFRHEAHTELDT